MKRLCSAAVLIVAVFAAVPAYAAKSPSYSPSLTTSLQSSTAKTISVVGETPYVVSGCGYNASFGGVTVVVQSPVAVAFAGQVPVDGCISLSNFATQGAGTYKINAWQHVRNKDVVVATDTFVVS